MKRLTKRILFGFLVLLTLAAYQMKKYQGSNNHPDGFHFFHAIHLDDVAIVHDGNVVVQPLMLSKDHDYDFVLKQTKAPVKLVIKDDHQKVVATNFNEENDSFYSSLIFECHISEFYTIEILSKEKESGECIVYSKSHFE